MIFLLIFALSISPLEGSFVNSPISHLSASLKVKCDSLLYRTFYTGTRCYFALSDEVKYSEATKLCASVFPGSQAASSVPASVFNALMLDKSKFHTGKDSSGRSFQSSGLKQSICIHESGYKCDVGEPSSILPGKCIDVTDDKMDLDKARMVCERKDMEFPSIGNELENRMIRDAVGKTPVWINNAYYYYVREPKWHRQKYFSKYSTCTRQGMEAGRETKCNMGQSSIIDITGYWGNTWEKNPWGNVCVKDAENEFKPKPKQEQCIALHEWDKDTELCEWTGPKTACLQMITFDNAKEFMHINNYPKEWTSNEISILGTYFNDRVSKVIVRRGCKYWGWGDTVDNDADYKRVLKGKTSAGYGVHKIPCFYAGDALPNQHKGLTALMCFCDPTESTVNDHVPAPPPRKKCIEHHVYNETTQSCEWIHDPKFCAELITNDGRRQMLEMPDYPNNMRYDVDHWNNETKRAENFHETITEVIVRQHCWVHLMHMPYFTSWAAGQRYFLHNQGYGKHKIASVLNGNYGQGGHPKIVICECLH